MNTKQYFHNVMMQSQILYDSNIKNRVCIVALSSTKLRVVPVRYFRMKNKGDFREIEMYHDEALTRLKRIVRS